MTALMWAAEKGNEAIVVELVRAGANVNEKNRVRKLLIYINMWLLLILCPWL